MKQADSARSLKRLVRPRIGGCAFCNRASYLAIWTEDLRFNEVACHTHDEALRDLADAELNGALRTTLSSSGKVDRKRPNNKLTDEVSARKDTHGN